MDTKVLAAMHPYFINKFFNPSATYLPAKAVHQAVEAARSKIAAVLGARPAEVIFTAGGTEANNLAVHGVMRHYPDKKVLTSSIEHESVLAPAHRYSCQEIPVLTDGLIDLTALERLIDDTTVLISIMFANNEIGTIQPIRSVADIVRQVLARRRQAGNNLPLYFHSDATQAANYLDLHLSRLGVDLLTLNGGKIYGPKQSGLLWVRSGLPLEPLIDGGGQERNLRSGTENVPGIVGFSLALEVAQTKRSRESERLQKLQQLFYARLAEKIPRSVINGSRTKRLPNNVHLTVPGQDNERLLISLDEAGILAAAGSACSASDQEPSHVLRALGLTDHDARSSLRFTMGRATTERDVQYTVDILARLIA